MKRNGQEICGSIMYDHERHNWHQCTLATNHTEPFHSDASEYESTPDVEDSERVKAIREFVATMERSGNGIVPTLIHRHKVLEFIDNGPESLKQKTITASDGSVYISDDEGIPYGRPIGKEPSDGSICIGCNSPASRCGPELWKQSRKCCPDCSHTTAGSVDLDLKRLGEIEPRLTEPSLEGLLAGTEFDISHIEEPEGEEREECAHLRTDGSCTPIGWTMCLDCEQEIEIEDDSRCVDEPGMPQYAGPAPQPHKTLRETFRSVLRRWDPDASDGVIEHRTERLMGILEGGFGSKREQLEEFLANVARFEETDEGATDMESLESILFGDDQ
jgi:hypothetical protein